MVKKRMIKPRKIAWKGEKVGKNFVNKRRNMCMSSTWTAQERKICLKSYLRLTFLLPYCNSYTMRKRIVKKKKKKEDNETEEHQKLR